MFAHVHRWNEVVVRTCSLDESRAPFPSLGIASPERLHSPHRRGALGSVAPGEGNRSPGLCDSFCAGEVRWDGHSIWRVAQVILGHWGPDRTRQGVVLWFWPDVRCDMMDAAAPCRERGMWAGHFRSLPRKLEGSKATVVLLPVQLEPSNGAGFAWQHCLPLLSWNGFRFAVRGTAVFNFM